MDADQLIAEVARTHGVRLGRDDAILIAATINRLTLNEALAEIRKAVQESQDQIAAGTVQQVEAAKATAARIITEAAGYAAERLRAAGDEAAQLVVDSARRQLVEIETARRAVVRTAYVTGAAVIIAGAALGCFLAAGL
jgi:hypothetical protein